MKKMKVVYLRITSFVGISIGASHHYGKLICGREHVELRRKLSRDDAEEMNRRWGIDSAFKKGDFTQCFNTEDEIKKLACATFKTHFPDADVLILGNSACADPQIILIGPKAFKDKVNAWYRQAEKIGWYDGGHMSKMIEIGDKFFEYFRKMTSK